MTIYDEVCELLDPLDQWDKRCHEASLRIVKSGVIPAFSRVARGWRHGVYGQHSWVVVGRDVYDPAAIIDPTLWSWDESVSNIVYERRPFQMRKWRPHGSGSIWNIGHPAPCEPSEAVPLTPASILTEPAQRFLALLGPLDRRGWGQLVNGPMQEWPSREIVQAVLDTAELKAMVPIDIQGMLTEHNPSDLYLRSAA